MSKESSVAPKERINIRYRPATGDAREEVELPLKILVMSDFTLREDDTPVEERPLIGVDKDNFNDVMRAQELALTTSVKDTLSNGGDDMSVSLTFETLKDFEPDRVAAQVPELKKLLELREALNALRGPLGNIPAFRRKIEALLGDGAARDQLLKELNFATND